MTPIVVALALAFSSPAPMDRGNGDEKRECEEYSNCGERNDSDTVVIIDLDPDDLRR